MKKYARGLLPLDQAKHARFKFASEYGFTFPPAVYPIDKSAGITDFGMGGNGPDPTLTVNGGKPVGDCGPNAVPKNANMIDAVLAGIGASGYTMTSDEIVELYFEYTNGQDVGVDLGDWLLWLFKKGLIKGFVKLRLEEIDDALSMGLAVVVGVNLNPQADDQVDEGKPWDIGPGDQPDPEDGHAILYIKANAQDGERAWASWGQQVISTYRWYLACPQQAFGVVTDPDALERNGFPVAQLLADLAGMGGTVAQPAPPVVGGLETGGSTPEGAKDDIERLVEDVEGAARHLYGQFPGLERVIKNEVRRGIEQALPAIVARELETLAAQYLKRL